MKNKQNQYVMCIISTPQDQAERIANEFVSRKLAACAQIINPIHSIYWWRGKIEHDKEALILLKTVAELIEKLKQTLKAVHPYEVPEFIVIPIQDGYTPYLSWIGDSLL
ncbi:MAG: divalent-cation tolerance protein CutA [Spirochaetales bacterium]|nr:divalent-cation tolerance protein CutA [Spirochaetales bacterium]